MSNKILYIDDGESVGLMSIADRYSVDDAVKSLPPKCRYAIFSEEDIENTEYFDDFFAALTINFSGTPTIDFDITKARDITKDRLRRERISLFEKNDILLRDAIVEGDQEKINIATKERDRLRDITLIVDQVDDLGDLLSIHP